MFCKLREYLRNLSDNQLLKDFSQRNQIHTASIYIYLSNETVLANKITIQIISEPEIRYLIIRYVFTVFKIKIEGLNK